VTPSPSVGFPTEVQTAIDELLPLCRALGQGRYAVSLGGSYGKGTSDGRSDLDFRLFCDARAPDQGARRRLRKAIEAWADRGIVIDGCWVRTIDEIEAQLDLWSEGKGKAPNLVWTIWGYHILTDVYNQAVVDDPFGILDGWRNRLSTYPSKLKAALVQRHTASLRYWRADYHYANKVDRGDVVFLAGITSRLVHDALRVLFALNETYYPGDGKNLRFADGFEIMPNRFRERVEATLYPGTGEQARRSQHIQLLALVDEVLALVPAD